MKGELTTETVRIDDVRPHPKNVRQGDIGAICESLQAHGQYRAIVAQRSTGLILAGNHTWKAAKQIGWRDIAVHFIDCDDDQAMRILLADNRANDLASYDDAALAELLKELNATELGLQGTLFDGNDLDELIVKLEGIHGFVIEQPPFSELAQEYEQRGIGVLSLPYDKDTLPTIKSKLNDLRNGDEKITYSDIVADLITKAHENNTRN